MIKVKIFRNSLKRSSDGELSSNDILEKKINNWASSTGAIIKDIKFSTAAEVMEVTEQYSFHTHTHIRYCVTESALVMYEEK